MSKTRVVLNPNHDDFGTFCTSESVSRELVCAVNNSADYPQRSVLFVSGSAIYNNMGVVSVDFYVDSTLSLSFFFEYGESEHVCVSVWVCVSESDLDTTIMSQWLSAETNSLLDCANITIGTSQIHVVAFSLSPTHTHTHTQLHRVSTRSTMKQPQQILESL